MPTHSHGSKITFMNLRAKAIAAILAPFLFRLAYTQPAPVVGWGR
jgi:hypothetical protein